MAAYNVLTLGASYGSLLATKLLFGGHKITMVCLPNEVEAFNSEGARIRMPIRGRKEPIELELAQIAGEPQGGRARRRQPDGFRSRRAGDAGAAIPLARSARTARRGRRAKVPCMSIMNMPPLPYLKRIPGLNTEPLKPAFTDAGVWTISSPAGDPVQPRPAGDPAAGEKINVLQVTLPTNFKVARFAAEAIHRDPAADGGRYRGGALQSGRRRDRAAGQAQGAQLDLSCRWPNGRCC